MFKKMSSALMALTMTMGAVPSMETVTEVFAESAIDSAIAIDTNVDVVSEVYNSFVTTFGTMEMTLPDIAADDAVTYAIISNTDSFDGTISVTYGSVSYANEAALLNVLGGKYEWVDHLNASSTGFISGASMGDWFKVDSSVGFSGYGKYQDAGGFKIDLGFTDGINGSAGWASSASQTVTFEVAALDFVLENGTNVSVAYEAGSATVDYSTMTTALKGLESNVVSDAGDEVKWTIKDSNNGTVTSIDNKANGTYYVAVPSINDNYTVASDDYVVFKFGGVDDGSYDLEKFDDDSDPDPDPETTPDTDSSEDYVAPEADDDVESEDDTDDTETDAEIVIDDIETEGAIEEVVEATPLKELLATSQPLFSRIEAILTLNITGSGKITVPVKGLKSGEKIEVFISYNNGTNWSQLPSSYLSTKGAMATMTNGVISNYVTSTGSSLNLEINVPQSAMIQIASVEAASTTTTGGSYTSATYHDSGSVRVNGSYITELRNVLVGELVNLSKITTVNGQEVTGWYYDSAMTKEITNPSQFVITSSVIGDGIYARTTGTTVVPDSYVDGSTNAGTGATTAPETTYQPSVVPSTVAKVLSKLF